MSIELILLAVNINLVSFSIFINDINGQIFTLFILTVAAAEAAVALAITINLFKTDYEKELQKLQNFNNIEEELIEKTWHPRRFQEWCLDEDQKEEEDEEE